MIKGKINKYASLDPEEKRLFRQAFWSLFSWRPVTFLFPMRWYAYRLGKKEKESSFEYDFNKELVSKLIRAMNRAESSLPWKSKCLTEAIATKRLLKKYNVEATLYLGVVKDPGQKLSAHAWLRCGDKIITGKQGYQKFTIVARFT